MQTHEGGKKTAATNIAKYGRDYYVELGRKGGSVRSERTKLKGFASNPERARLAGKIGGSRKRKTKENYTIGQQED